MPGGAAARMEQLSGGNERMRVSEGITMNHLGNDLVRRLVAEYF